MTTLAVDVANTTAQTGPIDWGVMVMTLFGGLALFLYGMDKMSEAIKAVAGSQMKRLLGRLTRNRIMGAISGAVVTAIIQSSSVTTVLVVGFVSAGLMSMTQSIGVIMGANIGTTVTAQIVAFKVTESALAFVAVGFALAFFSRRDQLRSLGEAIMGLGLIFFGMGVMSQAMEPLRTYEPFIDLMRTMDNPVLAILVAAIFTALVQSSSATTGIVVVLASQGFVTLEAGIALALGANIGTCVTAMLASIGKPAEAKRAAAVHVLFNVAGAALWIGFIGSLADLAIMVSPVSEELEGSARLAADAPRQIANANTIFNLVNTVLFLAAAGPIARLVTRLVPDRPEPIGKAVEARYLDPELLDTPSLALQRVRMELGHVGERVLAMVDAIWPAIERRDEDALRSIIEADDAVDHLERLIFRYLAKIGAESLSTEDASALQTLLNATSDLEHIGDLIETELVPLILRVSSEPAPTDTTAEERIQTVLRAARDALAGAVLAVSTDDAEVASSVRAMKRTITPLIESAGRAQTRRLMATEQADADDRAAIRRVQLELEIIETLRRIYSLSKRIARGVGTPLRPPSSLSQQPTPDQGSGGPTGGPADPTLTKRTDRSGPDAAAAPERDRPTDPE